MLKISVAAMVAVLGLGGCTGSSEDAATTEKLRQSVVSKLRDPSSVQFRDEKLTKSKALCGEMNAKNASGTEAGFTRFVVEPDGTAHMPTDSGGRFETAWAKHCV